MITYLWVIIIKTERGVDKREEGGSGLQLTFLEAGESIIEVGE